MIILTSNYEYIKLGNYYSMNEAVEYRKCNENNVKNNEFI